MPIVLTETFFCEPCFGNGGGLGWAGGILRLKGGSGWSKTQPQPKTLLAESFDRKF